MEYLKNSDKLFAEEKSPDVGAWLKNPANKFFLYSEGYKKAGDNLQEYCVENPFYSNSLVYPMVYTYRQYIELRLKELIVMGNKFNDINNDFPDEHSLLKLWNIYRNQILPNIEKIDKEILDNVERIIAEFNSEDPKSMSFRYPLSKGPNREANITRDTIDLKNFRTVIDKLADFFSWQWEMISHYTDMKSEMIADNYSQYWG